MDGTFSYSNLSLSRLRDDDLIKITQIRSREYSEFINKFDFPKCQAQQSHGQFSLVFLGIRAIEEETHSFMKCQFEGLCEKCVQSDEIKQSFSKILPLRDFLIQTFQTVNYECQNNYFSTCIDPVATFLEDSLKELEVTTERLLIYCEELRQRIATLKSKAETFPPVQVRAILQRIEERKFSSEEEKNTILQDQLQNLSEKLFVNLDEFQTILRGAAINVSLYTLLGQKAKSDCMIISHTLDRSCFLLNDIDHAAYSKQHTEKLLSALSNARKVCESDKDFTQFKKQLQFDGLTEHRMYVDDQIDYPSLFAYEKFKFQLQDKLKNSDSQQGNSNRIIKPTIIAKSPLQKELPLNLQPKEQNKQEHKHFEDIPNASIIRQRRKRIFQKENIFHSQRKMRQPDDEEVMKNDVNENKN